MQEEDPRGRVIWKAILGGKGSRAQVRRSIGGGDGVCCLIGIVTAWLGKFLLRR